MLPLKQKERKVRNKFLDDQKRPTNTKINSRAHSYLNVQREPIPTLVVSLPIHTTSDSPTQVS